jgi:epoxyqueuosine reductase
VSGNPRGRDPGLTPAEVTRRLVDEARRLGFHRAGVAAIDAPTRYRAYRRWLADGYAGSMAYLSAPHHLEARRDLRALAERARTVVVVALAYARGGGDAAAADGPHGFVARYARGADYHTVLFRKLGALADALAAALGRPVAARPCVDSAPVLERDLAEAAGLGFVAKNTMLIAPGLGSYLVLGELLLDVDAAPTPAVEASAPRCGECRACLDACPTNAFVGPHVLDARRCISYLTIEHRGVIDPALRAPIGTRMFGCDVCQDVCPFNAAAPDRVAAAEELRGEANLDPIAILGMGSHQIRRLVDGTAMRRATRAMLRRNACVALGNAADAAAVPVLTAVLRGTGEPVVRGPAAWALGRLGAHATLGAARDAEKDTYVTSEIVAALESPA